jgi:nicotinamide-nucleotide amidase
MTNSVTPEFSVSVLATGSEILDGRVLDTNSNFVARTLSSHGIKLKRVLVVDDDMSELLAGLYELAEVSDLIITSGGLGPTSDDLTRELVAKFFNVTVHEFPAAREHLERFYAKRSRPLDQNNLRQALLPKGSEMIPNQSGTAPGFILKGTPSKPLARSESGAASVTVCSLSGVPKEFKAMFNESVLPLIRELSGAKEALKRHTFKIFGVAESVCGRAIEALKLGDEVTISYRATFPEVHIVLKGGAETDLTPAIERVRGVFEPHGVIYTEAPEVSFVESVHHALKERGLTVACAESCTGGLVSSYLTEVAGASEIFAGGVVAYSNRVKRDVLGVSEATLKEYGAVSQEVVREMSRNVRRVIHGSSYGVGISGVAGPGGGSADKPVGSVWISVAGGKAEPGAPKDGEWAWGSDWSLERGILQVNDRRSVQVYAAYVALDIIRRLSIGARVPEMWPVVVGG